MHFAVENAKFVAGGKESIISMVIKDNEIRYFGDNVSMFTLMKMDTSPFVLTPSHVMFITNFPTDSFVSFKKYVMEHLLANGCGTIITDFTVSYDFEFETKLMEKRTSLLNCPIDYVLGVRIPASKLTTSTMKKCKKAKVPVVFVEINNRKELGSIPWGWIKEAAFPYNPLLIPIFPSEVKVAAQKRISSYFSKLLEKEKINHLSYPLSPNKPLDEKILKKIGLYPKRGVLRTGGEISYNLSYRNSLVEQKKTTYYDSLKLAIAVHKGRFTFIDSQPIFRPGFGEEILINQTALFV